MKRIYIKETFDRRLYWVWAAMIQRCHNPSNAGYERYGGRGITVCDRWREYKNFAADVGVRPDGMTIDRPENNKGYGPDNFRWADRFVQAGNRRYCIMVPDGNESVPLKEYCRRHDLIYRPIAKRVRNGWSVKDAISIPLGSGVRGPGRKIYFPPAEEAA
ncbi:MAG: hypothetical protein M3O26_16405 [Pseudomonadota bacterium]|nr:hypothetical protein [Pseudomonadota bacterium]